MKSARLGLLLLFAALCASIPPVTPFAHAADQARPASSARVLLPFAAANDTARTWPDTTATLRVFNDQLATWEMNDAQFAFAAAHYVGTQKVTRAEARRLRQSNPNFLVLHYRLGQALGHSTPYGPCQPTTSYLQIIDGDRWVQEWPGDANVQENWFYHVNGARVFNCYEGHYLMELDDAGWRAWWSAQVIAQLQNNEDDGLFADSYSVPNYLGPLWNPPLPEVDAAFESAWAAREHAFTDYMRGQFAGRWKWIPNVGAWITTRDPSDYSNVDGAMIEGWSEWGGGGAWFDPADWELQMNRTLGLTRAGKIVIAQTYPNPNDVEERLFALGSYLLVKGARTYINLDIGMDPEWFPEYGVNLGAPVDSLPASISTYLDPTWGVYMRRFANGRVLVNPFDTARTIVLGGTYFRVVPSGGGFVPADGTAPGSLSTVPVTSLTLNAHSAAILMDAGP